MPVFSARFLYNELMNFNLEKGASDKVFVIGIIAFVVLAWLGTVTDKEGGGLFGNLSGTSTPENIGYGGSSIGVGSENGELPGQSPFYGDVRISRGNGSYEYQPYQEYVTLRASSGNDEPINITGWILENGAGQRYYQVGSSVVRGTATRATIPQGVKTFYLTGLNSLGQIILEPGDDVVVVTGSPLPVLSKPIVSFKVNKCSGYIEEFDNVNFVPSLSLGCPDPDDYPEVVSMESNCRDFIRRLNRCETPEFKDIRTDDGGVESGAVNGVLSLSNQCKAFLENHINYSSCVADYINDDDFYKNEWRIWLGKDWEMWGSRDEIISLYDSRGLLVDRIDY